MKNTSTFKGKYSNEVYQIKKKFNCNSKMVVYLVNEMFAESNTKVPSQNLVLEPITIKAHIVIFGKNKNCQTKPVTRNVISNIIWRMTITRFVTRRSK